MIAVDKELQKTKRNETTHKYLTSIDAKLWNDVSRLKQLDARTTSINQMVNEGLRMLLQQRVAEMNAYEKTKVYCLPSTI